MRLLGSLLWTSAALEAYTASAQALLYTSEQRLHPSKESPPSISPITTRLLLAQRLGLSQYHSLEDVDEATLEILNDFGAGQQRVFSDDDEAWGSGESVDEKVLLMIEGVAEPKDIFGVSRTPAVSIEQPPSTAHNIELAMNLLEQDRHSRSTESGSGSIQFRSSSTLRGGFSASLLGPHERKLLSEIFDAKKSRLNDYLDIYNSIRAGNCGHTTILHDSSLLGLTPKDGDRYKTALSDLRAAIDYIFRPDGPSSTVIIMPTVPKSSKRDTTSPYGTYANTLSTRQQQPEEPLHSPSTQSTHKPSAPEILQVSASPLPHGVLPICHPTLDSANAATNNCSGHGTVYKKSGRSGDIECFACKCVKTVLTADNGGVKTVYWGGPACQKKDISVPFFLLAGLSIALVGAVTWGVGLMASIGQEELPSVIGAGVTGPRAQK